LKIFLEGINFTEKQLNFLILKSKEKNPIEACGLLFGKIYSKSAKVLKIRSMNNVLDSSNSFQVDPQEFLIALYEAEKKGFELIGFFHSHPAPPEPSITDVKFMRLWPNMIWIIISSLNYDVAAYKFSKNEYFKVPIQITN
jgi:proteasome lid subunit RPN8/RPN11